MNRDASPPLSRAMRSPVDMHHYHIVVNMHTQVVHDDLLDAEFPYPVD
jgi:hypothetical protein